MRQVTCMLPDPGVSNGQLQQLEASVSAVWLAPLPGDANNPDQPELQGSTQGTADSTGHISIHDLVLLGTSGTYNLSLVLLDFPQVYAPALQFLASTSWSSLILGTLHSVKVSDYILHW